MVSASQLTDNPALMTAQEKLMSAWAYIANVPSSVWRRLLILLSAIWICHSLADLFWLVLPTPEPPPPPKVAVAPQHSAANTQGASVVVDIAAIQAQELFGSANPAEAEQSDAKEPINSNINTDVKTRLNLKLQGVIASEMEEHARAIIDDGKEQLLLRVGEELPRNRGVKLARVMDNKVILDNKGSYEALVLYDKKDFSKPRQKTSSRIARRTSQPASTTQKATVSKSQMPRSISDIVRFSVHRENGQMVGYRIRPGREREVFDQVGLKANDIVTTVNGIRMDDPKQLKTVYQSLRTATSADLGVLRGGEELSITISVEGE